MRSARISGAFRDRLYLRGPFSADTAPGKRKAGDARIAESTKGLACVAVIGLPVADGANLYNAAAVLFNGKIHGIVPKQNIPNYGEFYEMRYFTPYREDGQDRQLSFGSERIPFGSLIFDCSSALDGLRFGVEICEDLWVRNRRPAGLQKQAH